MRQSLTAAFAWTLLVVLAPLTTYAQPAQSHLGLDIGDHVVLKGFSSGDDDGCLDSFLGVLFRVLPDGSKEPQPFEVPAGRLLVITDVEWEVDGLVGGGKLNPGRTVFMGVSIGGSGVFRSRSVEVGFQRGRLGTSEQLTAGFPVGEGTQICTFATQTDAFTSSNARLVVVLLRGYLIDAP